jgi:CBS domain-containing membrane protein
MRRNEPISKIMTANPATAPHGTALSEVRNQMTELQCHHMPVVSGDELEGMISSTDLLRVTYEYDEDPRQSNAVLDHARSVEDVMQPSVVTVSPKDIVRSAAQIFSETSFHALPVYEHGALVGIVTTTDIINYLIEQY